MLPTSCAADDERRIRFAFQPMPTRRAMRKRGLPAEGLVELAPRPGGVLPMRLRLRRGTLPMSDMR
jgi:hypothetical protein